VILGGLAVGIGFGLRDIANNFVSGVLLLMERPAKEGDFITIADIEGEVSRIRMRSMVVTTWDNMEVMVPNSEVFSKPFTNWTHQDDVVRTVITLKIHRYDEPAYVRDLVLDVLEQIEGVLDKPTPTVLLRELDDVLVEFQVRYFINIHENARVIMRSKVLFAIWDKFKQSGIRAPYPQQEVQLTRQD